MTRQPQSRAAVLAHPSVQRVRDALAAHQIVTAEVTILDGAARTAAQAAAYLGISPAQIANSLVFTARAARAPAEPLLVLTAGAHRVDTIKVADLLELAELGRADAELVRKRTGFVIGGVAPVGHTPPVRTLIDVSSPATTPSGPPPTTPHAVFPTTYDELLRMSGGQPIEVI